MKTSSANWRKVDEKRSSFEYHLKCTWTLNTGLVKWRKQEIQMRIDEERMDNVPSYSACSGGGASVTSLWAGLRATPIICAGMTIGKIAPRGQWCRRARHGAAGQHGSYRHITKHCPCHWWFWLQAQVWHLGRWQHVLNNYEKPRFSLHYMWHIVTYP